MFPGEALRDYFVESTKTHGELQRLSETRDEGLRHVHVCWTKDSLVTTHDARLVGRTLSDIYRKDVSVASEQDKRLLTRITVLIDSQGSTGVLDEEMQNTNLATLKALLDATFHFFGDEVASLGPRGEGAVPEVSGRL